MAVSLTIHRPFYMVDDIPNDWENDGPVPKELDPNTPRQADNAHHRFSVQLK